MSFLSIDFETASRANLKRTGAHKYARDPSTRILCMAWAFDDQPVAVWRPGEAFPARVRLWLLNGGVVKGWNIMFEFLIWNHVLVPMLAGFVPSLGLDQLDDTMAQAAYYGLPLDLDTASRIIGRSIKNAAGHRLMLQMCKPRSVDDDGTVHWWHEEDADKYDELCRYCADDVLAERSVGGALLPLPAPEREVWQADAAMNLAGVAVDPELIYRLILMAEYASDRGNQLLWELTEGQVRTVQSHRSLLAWLIVNTPYAHDNLRKATVEERLQNRMCVGLEREVLELRIDTAKTSAAKLSAMLDAMIPVHGAYRVCGMMQYYGAQRTGRWAGRLVQLQNLPRPVFSKDDLKQAIKLILADISPEALEALYGPLMPLISSAIRACMCAPLAYELCVADFSQIEARVLAWLTGQLDMLSVFQSGEDPYLYAAGLQGSTDRQFGKVLVLALGYGMGAPRFQATARTYGVVLTLRAAEAAVWQWREDNSDTRAYWHAVQVAAKEAIRNPSRITRPVKVSANAVPIEFYVRGGDHHLVMTLPSGRELIYRQARLEPDPVRPDQDCITYMGINQYTRRWERIRTWGSKLVENATQALARDLLARVIVQLVSGGLLPVLTVHDELLCEAVTWKSHGVLAEMLRVMRSNPQWAYGLPLDAAGWVGLRYRK